MVPLLAAAGVHLIATAIAEDSGYIADLGAAEVIDYQASGTITETLRRYPDGVDAMVNLALPGPDLVSASRVIRPGGRLINVAFPSPDPSTFDRADLTVRTVYSNARPGDLDDLAAQAMNGTLPPTITRHYPLEEATRAYADLVRTHVHGKLLVTMHAAT